MIFEWDEAKNTRNRSKHGFDFDRIYEFGWRDAVLIDRTRLVDGELRQGAIGYLGNKLHAVVFTKRGLHTRIISFRRANWAEEKTYENAHA